ncbi:MAG TPA: hypothetical protein V6D06_14755 [Trichocoleus sp.]
MTTAEIIQAIRASLATVSSDLYPHTSVQLLNDAQHHVDLALSCLDDYLEAQQAVSLAAEADAQCPST